MNDKKGKAHNPRTKVACGECRKNKRKCDGGRPSCLLCEKAGRVCVYVEDVSNKRKFVDDGLVWDLQNRIAVLESVVRQYRDTERRHGSLERTRGALVGDQVEFEQVAIDQLTSTPYAKPSSLPRSSAVTERIGKSPNADGRSAIAMEELASLLLTLDVEDKGEPSFMMSSGKSKAIEIYEQEVQFDSSAINTNVTTTTEGSLRLSLESREQLMTLFMQRFNIFHQFLEEDDTASIVDTEPESGKPDFRFRNQALFAVGAYFSDLPEAYALGSLCALSAEAMAFHCIKWHPSDLVAQGLTLLAWRELVLGHDSMAYNYIAMATGAILHQGLHVTAMSKLPGENQQGESFRRRVRSFWAYFSVDRLLTSSLGMNCTMHWQRIRMPLYLRIIKQQISIDDLAHDRFCQLWHLWDSCMDQVHAFSWSDLTSEERKALVVRSHQTLEDFYTEVDDRLSAKKDVSESIVWFQLAYHASLLLIHRPFLNEPKGSFTLSLSLRSATSAASSISRIIRGFKKQPGFHNVAPQVIDYILSAAVIHLLNATSGRTTLGRQSAKGLTSCLEALLDMNSKWKARVQRSITRIQELAHRWNVVWALPRNLSQPIELTSQPLSTDLDANTTPPLPASNRSEINNIAVDPSYPDFSFGLPMDQNLGDANLWDPQQYGGALDQIHSNWDMDLWNMDMPQMQGDYDTQWFS
ncbi:hypothetical protein BJ875DRAFT_480550 [Amylocarpus encephaloides]|uniref:Zn(2)-C6 fungal-type domain-containing protein n=1 Tax=Amylocarpus encephaloides TaxID=45428 RepID=A0A9P7YQY4_9HELO|nr:hypothetical protein BJ875DRAFT_480550 [Amylocarpus encephaloides]